MKRYIAKIIVMCILFSLMFGNTAALAQNPVDEPVGQLKILARYNDSMSFYDGHVYLLS